MKLAIFSGSTRTGSINQQLQGALLPRIKLAGFEVSSLSLADYEMPLYNGDWEEANGAPKAAKELAAKLAVHDAVIVISPEYNGGLPAGLKNTLDWMTRIGSMDQFHKPIWAIASCTPGPCLELW